jgi:hypothetical protein
MSGFELYSLLILAFGAGVIVGHEIRGVEDHQ